MSHADLLFYLRPVGSAGLSGGPRLTKMHRDRESKRAEGDLRKDRRKEKR